jgi:hypothetical protein
VLGRITVSKRDKESGGWSKLYVEELHNLYTSSKTIRGIKSRMRGAGHVARMGQTRNLHKILVEEHERKRTGKI